MVEYKLCSFRYTSTLKPQDIRVILPVSNSGGKERKKERKKEKRPFAFCDAGSIYTWRIILIPHTHVCHPKPCRQGQCHCHSETVKVWSFCPVAHTSAPSRSCCSHARTRRHTHRHFALSRYSRFECRILLKRSPLATRTR